MAGQLLDEMVDMQIRLTTFMEQKLLLYVLEGCRNADIRVGADFVAFPTDLNQVMDWWGRSDNGSEENTKKCLLLVWLCLKVKGIGIVIGPMSS